MVEQAKKHLEKVPEQHLVTALEHIDRAKRRLARPQPWDIGNFRRIDAEIWDLRVATLGEEGARQLSVEDGKRSPVELY